MKETGDISKSQYPGTTKRGTCGICGKDISNYSWEKQNQHAIDCQNKLEEEHKQTRLF